MTFTPTTYRAVLLRTVSPRILGWVLQGSLDRAALCASADRAALCASAPNSPLSWLSVLARMRLWLSLVFKGTGETDIYRSVSFEGDDEGLLLNRGMTRRSQHKTPAAHDSYALGHILLRRYGYARFIQWLYQFGLIGRICFCFVTRRGLFWGLLWARRAAVAVAAILLASAPICAAPLSPD